MSKRSQPMMNKDVHDYEGLKGNKHHDQNKKQLQYFIDNAKTISILKKKNIKELYPIQAQTYRSIYKGLDVIARDRTGSGKTLAFTLPVIERLRESKKFLHRAPKFLIILPTRELVIQVHNQIESLKYKDQDDYEAYCVYGKTSIQDNIRRLKSGVDILVATPGRLNDLITRGAVMLDSIEILCLDEADQILKQGFKEEIQKVFAEIHKVNTNKIQILLFSATIPQWLKQLSEQYQGKDTPYINMIKDDQIRTSKTIKHYAVQVSRMGEFEVVGLIEDMIEKFGGNEKRILIFCQKKVQVDNLSKNLKIQNQPLHGDVHQKRRQNAYRNFKSGLLKCIVATNVAARGLDFPSVDLVIQMRPPMNTEQYIHRAGRTGRAGKSGTCLTFFDRTRTRVISKIQDEANIRIEQLKIESSKGSSSSRYDNDRGSDRDGRNFNRDADDRRGSRDNYHERRDTNRDSSRHNNGDRQRCQNNRYDSSRSKIDSRTKYQQKNERRRSPQERNRQETKPSPCRSRTNSRSPQRKSSPSPLKEFKTARNEIQEKKASSKASYDDDY